MKLSVHHTVVATCLGCLITWPAFALAPVVDESENFALFDEQLAATERPASPPIQAHDTAESNESIALAYEDTSLDERPPQQDDATLLNKLQNLQQDLNNLRGQLEVQTHELQVLKQQQLDFYKDLDGRLRDPNTQTQAAASAAPEAAPQNAPDTNPTRLSTTLPESAAPRGNPADEQISYLAAYELIKSKEFDKAVIAMNSFISQYPRGGYTANAHYWLGELYMVQKAYPDAIQQFQTVIKVFPSSSKTSDCSLKIGYALAASGEKRSARQQLQEVIRDYPDTHAAELAATKLETLNS